MLRRHTGAPEWKSRSAANVIVRKSLVEDGLNFTKAKVEEARGGGKYTAVLDVDADFKDVVLH